MAFISQLKKDFVNLVDRGKLSHSYIFFGGNAETRLNFGKSFLNYIENREWAPSQKILLDANIIDASVTAGIDAARRISNFLWQKPIVSKKRSLAVLYAESLTPEAQNAILKIAEDPPVSALIILSLSDPELLIKPLASRFQKIYISSEKQAVLGSPEAKDFALKILKVKNSKERAELIKQILEQEALLSDFISEVMAILKKDMTNNWPVLKEILYRWSLINRFNTNKKLQLEAAFISRQPIGFSP